MRTLAGTHASDFGEGLHGVSWKVSTQSDRMGIRLEGPPVPRSGSGEVISSAVAPGTVQIPPSGCPIVLLADAQTLGGYPRAAHVISVDLPLLAQLAPGDSVCFERTTLEEAHELAAASERSLALLRNGLSAKLRRT